MELRIGEFFHAIHDGIAITDHSGKFIFVNKAYEELMGLNAKDVLNKNVGILVEEQRISQSVTLEILKHKKPSTILQHVYKTNKDLLISAIPLTKNGEITHVVSILRDFTELVTLKQQIDKTKIESHRIKIELDRLKKKHKILKEYIFESESMKEILQLIIQIAEIESSVLLKGESGVGKEIITKIIHQISNFSNGNFVAVNCGAIPENLMESEFFGYDEGAFTGASKKGKVGYFELANNGTLFLDEIGEMPLNLQVKLLRVIQDKAITRIGSKKIIKTNFRLISATNRNLKDMVNEGKFRLDLYYRLNVIPINIPPLRERKEEIPFFIEYFVKKINEKYNLNKILSPTLIQELTHRNWPGNIRELENTIERLIVTSPESIISNLSHNDITPIEEPILPLKEYIENIEKEYLATLYSKYQSTRQLARLLKCDQSTIARKLNKHNITLSNQKEKFTYQ